ACAQIGLLALQESAQAAYTRIAQVILSARAAARRRYRLPLRDRRDARRRLPGRSGHRRCARGRSAQPGPARRGIRAGLVERSGQQTAVSRQPLAAPRTVRHHGSGRLVCRRPIWAASAACLPAPTMTPAAIWSTTFSGVTCSRKASLLALHAARSLLRAAIMSGGE